MGETRVDLHHLLEDLRDAYPGTLEETILTEIVANSLDSRATTIGMSAEPAHATLTIVDDGRGMRRRELARYHDIAASTKSRGEGIGFAGVGIKLGLLACDTVVTETRLDKHHVATTWGLASRHRAPWRWIPPPGLVGAHGTAVRLTLQNVLSPLLDAGFLETALRRHFQPLLDPRFAEIMAGYYPRGVRFVVNGHELARESWSAFESAPVAVRLVRKRKPSAAGYLIRDGSPLSDDRRGLAVSTFGKVIKQGWDWLGVTPAAPDRIGGLIEVPALAGCLTLNKADFIRGGARGAAYLAYRKAIQEVVSHQLALWGDSRDGGDPTRRRATRPAERDLQTVVMELVARFPLLSTLVEQRAGGQRRLPIGPSSREPQADVEEPVSAGRSIAAAAEAPDGPGRAAGSGPPGGGPSPAPPADRTTSVQLSDERRGRRPGHYGLGIQFDHRPDDPELGRLVESTIWINEAHPAYRRAVASRAEGYHIALAAAMALAPLAAEPAREHAFVTAFLASWGTAIDRRPHARRR
jgi:Histidine kinase-, DNA gyrase B-, and HSP90-like ATPase